LTQEKKLSTFSWLGNDGWARWTQCFLFSL